jgi:hypothetical protein
MARQGGAWRGKAWQGKAWLGSARQGLAGQGVGRTPGYGADRGGAPLPGRHDR